MSLSSHLRRLRQKFAKVFSPSHKARKGVRPIESRRMSVEPLEHRNLLSIDLSSLPHQIVDTQDPGYTQTGGGWQTYNDTNAYQGSISYHAGGTGTDGTQAQFAFPGLAPTQSYQVFVTWTAANNRASNCPFTVCDGATPLATVQINQQFAPENAASDGTTWESLGVYQVATGTLNVQLGDAANGYVIADAACVAPVPATTTAPAVIDNADPSFAESGSAWLGWSSPDLYEGDCRYAPAGTGQNTATWSFNNVDPTQEYQVYATWNGSSNHASNAPYTIFDGTTALATVQMNQQNAPSDASIDGSQWQSLGVYTAASGNLTVQLSDNANGFVVANAIRLVDVTPPPPPPAPVVVDSADAAFTETGSAWLGWSSPDLYDGSCRYAPAGTGQDTATWTFNGVDPAQEYQVYTTWNASSNHASNAPYTVLDGMTPLATVRMNQQYAPCDASIDGSQWQSLGVYTAASGDLVVQLSDDANGFVVANAVRLVPVETPATAPSVIDTGDAAYAETGNTWLTWDGSGLYEGDCRYAPAGTGQNTATWNFQNVTPAYEYQVLVTYNASSNHADNAPFTVSDGGTTLATVPVDQQVAPSGPTIGGTTWQSLGTFYPSSGDLSVQLSNNADGFVVADAVQIVPVAPVTLEWDPTGALAAHQVDTGTNENGVWSANGGNVWYDTLSGRDVPWVDGARADFSGAGTVTVDGTVSPSQIVVSGNYTFQSGAISLAAAGVTAQVDGSLTVASTLTGPGELIETGTGTITVSAANTYSGGTQVLAGNIALAGASPLGTGPVELAGGTLQFTATAGFSGSYYNVVNDGYVPDFTDLTPVATRTDATIDFPNNNSGFAPGIAGLDMTDSAAEWTGELNVTSGGSYTFQTTSDDGSLIYVDGQQVVNDDGPHAMQTATGTVELAPGEHAITVEYTQAGGGAGIIVQYSGADTQGAMVDLGSVAGSVTSGGTLNLANAVTVTADSTIQLPASGGTATIASLAMGGQTLNVAGTGAAGTLAVAGPVTLSGPGSSTFNIGAAPRSLLRAGAPATAG